MYNEDIKSVIDAWKANVVKAPSKSIQIEVFEQIASMFAAGPFYYSIYDFITQSVQFTSDSVKTILGIPPEKNTMIRFFKNLHPLDVLKLPSKEKISGYFFYEKLNKDERLRYKTVYLMRLKNSSGNYRTILHQAKPINISNDGKVQQVLIVHTDVTHLNIPINHRVSFIGDNRPSYFAVKSNRKYKIVEKHIINHFTKREKEIVKKIVEGKNYKEIAEELFISPNTVNEHKRNILEKSDCKNTAELVKMCIVEGVI